MYRLAVSIAVAMFFYFAQGQTNPCRGTGSGTLSSRLMKNIRNNDANNDSFVTGDEIYDDLTRHYDKDNDSCVTLQEWVDAWADMKFSAEYATARLEDLGVNLTSSCPVNVSRFQGASIPLNAFVNANLDSLIKMCDGNQTLYTTVCDCFQLKRHLCNEDPYFNALSSCQKYVSTVVVG